MEVKIDAVVLRKVGTLEAITLEYWRVEREKKKKD